MTDTVDSLRERVAELERTLACERGDASGAPDGWRFIADPTGGWWSDPRAGGARVCRNRVATMWRAYPPRNLGSKDFNTALDAMRYCDAVHAGGGK